MRKILALLVAIQTLLGGFARAQDSVPIGPVAKLTPPAPDKRQIDLASTVSWPLDREALVYVAVKINAKGKVIESTHKEGGFYDPRFVNAALKISRNMRFIPAQLNGEPVEYQSVVPIRFSMPSARGGNVRAITQDFRKEALKVQTLIEQKDIAGAHFHAEWMMAEKVKLSFEYAILQYTLAVTHARSGNVHRALAASRGVTTPTSMSMDKYQPGGSLPKVSARDFMLANEPLDEMLKLRFSLAASQGFYLEAANAQANRQALGYAASDDSYARDTTKLLEALKSVPELHGHARIDEANIWDHELWFNRFTIRSLRGGSLSEMTLTCDGYSRVLTYAEGAEWSIPSRWSNCRLRITGTSGTEFDIIEFRDASPTSPASPAN